MVAENIGKTTDLTITDNKKATIVDLIVAFLFLIRLNPNNNKTKKESRTT